MKGVVPGPAGNSAVIISIDPAECFDTFVVYKNIKFEEISCFICFKFIVHSGISFGCRFEFVVEIDKDLSHRHLIFPYYSARINIIHTD